MESIQHLVSCVISNEFSRAVVEFVGVQASAFSGNESVRFTVKKIALYFSVPYLFGRAGILIVFLVSLLCLHLKHVSIYRHARTTAVFLKWIQYFKISILSPSTPSVSVLSC